MAHAQTYFDASGGLGTNICFSTTNVILLRMHEGKRFTRAYLEMHEGGGTRGGGTRGDGTRGGSGATDHNWEKIKSVTNLYQTQASVD